jgi:hypothetical protein
MTNIKKKRYKLDCREDFINYIIDVNEDDYLIKRRWKELNKEIKIYCKKTMEYTRGRRRNKKYLKKKQLRNK